MRNQFIVILILGIFGKGSLKLLYSPARRFYQLFIHKIVEQEKSFPSPAGATSGKAVYFSLSLVFRKRKMVCSFIPGMMNGSQGGSKNIFQLAPV